MLRAEQAGKEARETFLNERIYKNKDFFEPVKQLKLKSMASKKKTVKLSSKAGKVIQYQEQGDIAFTLLVKAQEMQVPISIEELMS